jgi:hypothetical protein
VEVGGEMLSAVTSVVGGVDGGGLLPGGQMVLPLIAVHGGVLDSSHAPIPIPDRATTTAGIISRRTIIVFPPVDDRPVRGRTT